MSDYSSLVLNKWNVLFCTLKSPVTVDSSVQIKGKAKCILLSINVPDKSVLKGKNEIISM